VIPKAQKNLIRGSRNPHKTLSTLRISIAPKHYRDLLIWLRQIHGRSFRVLNPAFPPNYSSLIPQSIPFSAIPFDRELLWCASRILNHASEINLFLKRKLQFESAWLRGDIAEAEDTLDLLEKELGTSLFLLEMRIAFPSITIGRCKFLAPFSLQVVDWLKLCLVDFRSDPPIFMLRNSGSVPPASFKHESSNKVVEHI
jgi:hypothetical protein